MDHGVTAFWIGFVFAGVIPTLLRLSGALRGRAAGLLAVAMLWAAVGLFFSVNGLGGECVGEEITEAGSRCFERRADALRMMIGFTIIAGSGIAAFQILRRARSVGPGTAREGSLGSAVRLLLGLATAIPLLSFGLQIILAPITVPALLLMTRGASWFGRLALTSIGVLTMTMLGITAGLLVHPGDTAAMIGAIISGVATLLIFVRVGWHDRASGSARA